MAEEKNDGLEGLEEFDDDFGEQLDSFMDNDGEDESDSELDSFFEDLSTIDDLDGEDESKSKEENTEKTKKKEPDIESQDPENDLDFDEEFHEEDKEFHEEDEENLKKENEKKKKKGGFPLKSAIISSIIGVLLGVFSILFIYFFPTNSEKELTNEVLKTPIKKDPVAKIIKPKAKPKIVKNKKKKLTKKITKKYSYDIQVVACISKECINESQIIIESLGYKSKIRNLVKKTGIAEVLSINFIDEEKAIKIINYINKNNPLPGYAFSKSGKNGYQISLGYFPALETANRVRTYLNQAFKEDVFFEIKRSSQKIKFQVLEVNGIKSIEEAEMLLKNLKKKNPNFESAFLKKIIKKTKKKSKK